MITLQNPGELDLSTLKTMGVSAKETDTPIGQFGTGMKYAIAIMLRENRNLEMYIGENRYSFYTEPKVIRGTEFQVCGMKGEHDYVELPFTTRLGMGWQVWQAYRELRSNCIDEGGSNGPSKPKRGTTTIRAEFYPDEVMGVFLEDLGAEKVYESKDLDIYKAPSIVAYYNGISAKILRKESRYTYNIKQKCTLTEDRQLAYDYDVYSVIVNAVIQMTDKELLRDILSSSDEWYEHRLPMSYAHSPASSEFMEVAKENRKKASLEVQEFLKSHEVVEPPTKDKIIRELQDICISYGLTMTEGDGVVEIRGDDLRV